MSNVKLDSKQNSDAASLTQRPVPPHPRSESGYLAEQAADARMAMVRTLQDMRSTLIQATDVRPEEWIAKVLDFLERRG